MHVACLKELCISTADAHVDDVSRTYTARDLGLPPHRIYSATVNEFGGDEDAAWFWMRGVAPRVACAVEEINGTFLLYSTSFDNRIRVRPHGTPGPDTDDDFLMESKHGWQRVPDGSPYVLRSGDIFELTSETTIHSPGLFMFIESVSAGAIRSALRGRESHSLRMREASEEARQTLC